MGVGSGGGRRRRRAQVERGGFRGRRDRRPPEPLFCPARTSTTPALPFRGCRGSPASRSQPGRDGSCQRRFLFFRSRRRSPRGEAGGAGRGQREAGKVNVSTRGRTCILTVAATWVQ